jgi:pyruvate/2-oxoglutarate dehydrogenase complex dihydrolipoamide acyltransferase (E2) component
MDLQLPRLAETLVEGTVSRWLKRPGDRVSKGEPLVEVETDKVNTELEAPADGVLVEVLVSEGETAAVGQVLARIGDAGQAVEASIAVDPSGQSTGPPEARSGGRSERRAEHLRRAAARVPQGACVREIPAGTVSRLEEVARAAVAGGVSIAVLPPSRSHLALPPLGSSQAALLVAGAERDGRRMLALCYDRRTLDDWSADQLLKRIATDLQDPAH